MTREEVRTKAIEILARKLGFPEAELLDESLNLWDDLGMDSLDAVEIAVELEQIFGIKILVQGVAYTDFTSVKDVINFIATKLNIE
jgi:acyl carrier protein